MCYASQLTSQGLSCHYVIYSDIYQLYGEQFKSSLAGVSYVLEKAQILTLMRPFRLLNMEFFVAQSKGGLRTNPIK